MRIASYNICEGGLGRIDAIASVVAALKADAVALIEATDVAGAAELARQLSMDLVHGDANDGMSIAWLSRLRIRRSENHRMRVLSKTLLELEVDSDLGITRLFATHLASRHDEPAYSRTAEIRAILTVLQESATVPHLLVGDFNSIHPSDTVATPPPGEIKRGEALDGAPRPVIQSLLDAGYVDCFRRHHPDKPGYTYPSEAPWLRLDYIFAPPALGRRLTMCDYVESLASDHFPVVAEFEIG